MNIEISSVENNFKKLLIAISVLLLFSSDRNLLITQYVIGGRHNIVYLTIISIFLVIYAVTFFTFVQGYLKFLKIYLNLFIIIFLLAAYFLIHELIFNDGLVSAKYAVFLMIIMLSFMVRYDFFFVFKTHG